MEEELKADFFMARDGEYLFFGCKVNDRHVYFVPFYHRSQGVPYVDGCTLSHEILACSPEEIRAVKEIFAEKYLAIAQYFDIFTCPNPDNYNYPPEYLRDILAFDLTDRERVVILSKLSELTKIYLIKDNRTGFIKIGRSNDPEQRLKTLIKQDTLLPEPNEFTLIGYTEAYPILETNLHKRFADKRVRGEWFELTDQDIQDVINVFGFFQN